MSPARGRALDAARLANPIAAKLRAYDPGHDLASLRLTIGSRLAELGANENPCGPGPSAREAMRKALEGVHRYPDPRAAALREAVAAQLNADGAELVFGNGSHELLMLLAQCFAGAEQAVLHSRYGFAVFSLAAAAAGAPSVCVDALPAIDSKAPLGHDLAAMRKAITPEVRLVYLANPNNPTGTWFDHADLASFLDAVPENVLVVVDEAYAEYFEHAGGVSAIELRSRFANLIVTRTFSKAYALAGLRVGYLVADESVCRVLEGLRESFNVGVVGQAAACASFDDRDWLRESLAKNHTERERLASELARLGYPALPSRTNFLLVDCGGDAGPMETRLFESGVIARPMAGYGLPGYLRISVGSAAESDRLLGALE